MTFRILGTGDQQRKCQIYWGFRIPEVAILHEDSTGKKGKITYRELKNITNKLANYFTSRGLKKGDYIAICLSQRTEAIISHIAAWKIGCVSAPVTIL
ncbi:MAG: hypothetical protein COW28_03605, partial [bacterium (Candidatus Ratteibacteria) CG15_BIG_FIL_POST_REV_8_21_14_020_41_12]